MIWNHNRQKKAEDKSRKESTWHQWYAWYPVETDDENTIAWRENVWRKKVRRYEYGLFGGWEDKWIYSVKKEKPGNSWLD